MGQEGSTKPARDKAARKTRAEREEEVRKKYDFSVIRTLRQHRGMTIEKFAKLCGLSYAPISRIETNLIKPNLETLDKIAAGLGITTYNLVAMAEKREARTQKGREFRAGGFTFHVFSFDGMDVAHGEGRKGATAEDLGDKSKDMEAIILVSGRLGVTVNDKEFEIGPGESIEYDRIFPHRIRALEDSQLILVAHSQR